jgi:hypothetical protein
MGFYIETDTTLGKADWLIRHGDAQEIKQPRSLAEVPEDKALVVVVENGFFDAAAYAYDEGEFRAFTDPGDPRPQRFLLMDKDIVELHSGYAQMLYDRARYAAQDAE